MKVRRLITDLDQINKLYRYSKIKNSPRTLRPLQDPDPNTKTIYLQKSTPSSITPMTITLKKYDTTTRDSHSKSPDRQNQYSFTSRGYTNNKTYNYYYNPTLSVRNYLETTCPNNKINNLTTAQHDIYKNISTISKKNLDSIYGIKNSLIPSTHKKGDGGTISGKVRNNRFITISPCSTSNAYIDNKNNNRNNSSKDKNSSFYVTTNGKIYSNHTQKIRNILYSNLCNEIHMKDLLTKSPYSAASRKCNKNYGDKRGLRIINDNCNISKDFNKYNKDVSINSSNNNYYITNTPIINKNYENKKGIRILLSTNSSKRSKKNSSRKSKEKKEDNPFFVSVDIQLDDLLSLEDKLNNIIRSLINNENIFQIGASNECLEFIVFYFHSSLQNKFAHFFCEGNNRIIAQSSINLLLYVIILTYHLSITPSLLTKLTIIIKKIYQLLKMNIYLLYRQIQLYNGENFTNKNQDYFKSYNYILERNNLFNIDENRIIQIINQNCVSIVNNVNIIVNLYESSNNDYYLDFLDLFTNLSRLTEQDFSNYFYNNLYNKPAPYIFNTDSNIKPSNFHSLQNEIDTYENQNNSNNMVLNPFVSNRQIPPFIRNKTKKKYTLVLDLDETLISMATDINNNYVCKFRPGLVSFLNDIKPYYELISFTTNTRDYSKFIVSQIEKNKMFFDYNLSREHSTLVGKDYVKDISKIGRDMKKIIIVDDIEENFRLNSDNGILISPYYGDDLKNDNVLYELKNLLLMFYKIGYDDLRLALRNYQSEIKEKISLCFD